MKRLMLFACVLATIGMPVTAGSAPTPTATTTLVFFDTVVGDGGCTNARVQFQWSDWRTTQVVLALRTAANTDLDFGNGVVRIIRTSARTDPDGFKAARNGSVGATFGTPATWGGNATTWAGIPIRGFGAAVNQKNVSINHTTGTITCTPPS